MRLPGPESSGKCLKRLLRKRWVDRDQGRFTLAVIPAKAGIRGFRTTAIPFCTRRRSAKWPCDQVRVRSRELVNFVGSIQRIHTRVANRPVAPSRRCEKNRDSVAIGAESAAVDAHDSQRFELARRNRVQIGQPAVRPRR